MKLKSRVVRKTWQDPRKSLSSHKFSKYPKKTIISLNLDQSLCKILLEGRTNNFTEDRQFFFQSLFSKRPSTICKHLMH